MVLTPTWCLRMARRPCTWRPEPSARGVCVASRPCCAEAGTPTLGEAGSGLRAAFPRRGVSRVRGKDLGVLERASHGSRMRTQCPGAELGESGEGS